jgi:diadenosine tetraphosphate (Ap4A) HIT family hydrolase
VTPDCELCAHPGGDLLWRDAHCRVVLIDDADYAGYCRVIWHAHAREMTDLDSAERAHCMRVVFAVEQALRNVVKPHKINLASFGNLTPHVHWHVIPRWLDDAHFPNSVWGERQRDTPPSGAAGQARDARQRLAAELLRLL